jgi:hypothetical protein
LNSVRANSLVFLHSLLKLKRSIPREKAWVYYTEYQTMSSLRDVAHDDVLCTFGKRSWAILDRGKWCGPSGKAAWTAYHVQHSARSLSSSQQGGPPCWASPRAFGLIDCTFAMWEGGGKGCMYDYAGMSSVMLGSHNRSLPLCAPYLDRKQLRASGVKD